VKICISQCSVPTQWCGGMFSNQCITNF